VNQRTFKKLITGNNPIIRAISKIAAYSYSSAITLRNLSYDKKIIKSYKVPAFVLSIGNITAGGTGKTPLVIWLCKFLTSKKFHCSVLTRGYKTNKSVLSDEPAMICENCPDTKIVVNPDRVAGAKKAIEDYGSNVLIMDDGFQHRRLYRDLNIVTIDSVEPFGYGKLLPSGLLREPVTSLSRADAVILTRCDQAKSEKLLDIERMCKVINNKIITARTIHAPALLKTSAGTEFAFDYIKNKRIFAFCGIGNPQSFYNTINSLGALLVDTKIYDDHYHYTDNDLAEISNQAGKAGADLILTTEKDWTKLKSLSINEILLAYLKIELKFLTGLEQITELIIKK
jgi:tetraacyldisaccharide 4'-kinase